MSTTNVIYKFMAFVVLKFYYFIAEDVIYILKYCTIPYLQALLP